MNLDINGERVVIDEAWCDETLLSVLREALGLVGAKFGCGVGLRGACTVLVDGQARCSCLLQAADLAGAKITTIEKAPGAATLQAHWMIDPERRGNQVSSVLKSNRVE